MNVITTDEIEKNPFLSATSVRGWIPEEEESITHKRRTSLGFVERALLASAYFTSGSTALYRVRGNDTLTIGQFDEWIEKKSAINVMILYAYNPSKPDLISRFKMINPVKVYKFLSKNTDLWPVLLEASRVIKQIFGEDAELILELQTDPEIEDNQILYANIKATGDIDEQLDKLDIFDKNWLVQQLDLINHRVIFDLDFS